MTMNDIQSQHQNFQRIDHVDNYLVNSIDYCLSTNNSYHRLFENSQDLLNDILNHPLLLDYFNVYLSLPIFGQRIFFQHQIHQFDFDPSTIAKHQTAKQIYDEGKEWLFHTRLENYIRTDIYIESLLGLLLIQIDETKTNVSSTLHTFIHAKESIRHKQSHIFSTVIDVRKFHQFLQSTSGIKYWDFFIDAMRLLQSRYSSRSNRIDISYLNFIYKYYSRHHEFSSIKTNLGNSLMPDSTTPDSVWFQMTINAMHQLRTYWVPRYVNQVSSTKTIPCKTESKSIESIIKTSSDKHILTSVHHISQIDTIINEPKRVKLSLENISYVDYNPQQDIRIEPSVQYELQDNFEESKDYNKTQIDVPSYSLSDRSIEDYAANNNIELFYRVLVSDSLAGSPFLDYISLSVPKTDGKRIQTCIYCITDAEILLSIPFGNFKEKILQQFIIRYLDEQIFANIEEETIQVIEELLRETDTNEYFHFWKFLLKITKFLIPYFLNYIKFDRLRFLIKGKISNINRIIDDLHYHLPLIHFDQLLSNQQNTKENNSNQSLVNETTRPYLTDCNLQQNDLLKSSLSTFNYTTEKQINTDEQCEFPPIERFHPLSEDELDLATILGKSFDTPIVSHQTDIKTFIDDQIAHNKTNEDIQSNLIESFTLDIINSARKKLEIDRFISNIIDESFHRVQINPSTRNDDSSSPSSSSSSSLFEETSVNDSSSTVTFPRRITNDINTNALVSTDSVTEILKLKISTDRKILSIHGSYFINSPSRIQISNLLSNHSINEFSLHDSYEFSCSMYRGLIKDFTMDPIGIGHLDIDLTKTNIISNQHNILKHNNKIKLYRNNYVEFLSANIKSYNIDTNKQELYLCLDDLKLHRTLSMNVKKFSKNENDFYESIKYAQKDKSNQIKNFLIENKTSYFEHNDQKQFIEFIQNNIHNHQWPLHEYIGIHGERAWRSLKLAADISNFDDGFMLNYHHDFDWILSNNCNDSFHQRTTLIVRNFEQRIENKMTRNS